MNRRIRYAKVVVMEVVVGPGHPAWGTQDGPKDDGLPGVYDGEVFGPMGKEPPHVEDIYDDGSIWAWQDTEDEVTWP